MSSMPGASAPPLVADARSAQAVVQWILPAGARGILAATVIVVALGLAGASYSVPGTSDAAIVAAPDLLIDLNTAPAPVLETLPHVGPTLVRQLVAARELRPLASLEELAGRVRGLGPSTVAQLRPFLRFGNSVPARGELEGNADRDWPVGNTSTTVRKRNRSRKPPATRLQPRIVAQPPELDAYSEIMIANHE
jgi:DNA uptake protein ComE-like DNA-binding protein